MPARGVLENDTDPDGNLITAVREQAPTHGQLTFNPTTGQFAYIPFANFHGQDTFTYKAFDGQLYSDAATVILTVNSVNDVPTAVADQYSLQQNVAGNASLTISCARVAGQ